MGRPWILSALVAACAPPPAGKVGTEVQGDARGDLDAAPSAPEEAALEVPAPADDVPSTPDMPDASPPDPCGGSCDDGDLCTIDTCKAGACEHDAISGCCLTDAGCADKPPCTGGYACDRASHTCQQVAPPPAECCTTAAECNDGDLCTGGAWCKDHTCTFGPPLGCPADTACLQWDCVKDKGCTEHPVACDDANACTQDSCAPGVGCVFTPTKAAASYDDGLPCNGLETCDPVSGAVVAGVAPPCEDGDPCNGTKACDPASGECFLKEASPVCNDGVACDGAETCVPGVGCVDGPIPSGCCQSLLECEDGNPCNGILTCNLTTGQCEVKAAALACDDGNPCTTEGCHPVTGCFVGLPVSCSDGNACNGAEKCDPFAGCVPSPEALVCGDGKFCNGGEWCDPKSGCQPGDPPTCSDGSLCNGLERCDDGAGACLPGVPLACNDGLPCNGSEQCDPLLGCVLGEAIVDPDGCCDLTADCEDGNPCNGQWSCDPVTKICKKDQGPLICDDKNACNDLDFCDPALGCAQLPGPTCDDGDLCDGLETCDPKGGCQPAKKPLACDDDDLCNGVWECHATKGCVLVVGMPWCQDGEPCTADKGCHKTQGCLYEPITGGPCDDGKPCTTGESCLAGKCSGGVAYACDDGHGCTLDVCDGGGACLPPKPLAGWCLLDGACVAEGTSHPSNPCLACQPANAALAWSAIPQGSACPAGPQALAAVCDTGLCVPEGGMCVPGWEDCDAWTPGCETAVWSDPAGCGGCGEPCAEGEVCSDAACAPACAADLATCGQACADLATHPEHCGACTNACDGPHQTGACAAGVCACEAGWSDPDAKSFNGCECAENGTPDACGPSCAVCEGGGQTEYAECVAGKCVKKGCKAGHIDLDGAWGNGCEALCAPGNEVCDGADNDCDGAVDEDLCEDGVDCTIDACDPAAQACVVIADDGACPGAGPCVAIACHPDLGCLTTVLLGASCDDGDPCTYEDACTAGECQGTPAGGTCCLADSACVDANPCTLDSCDLATVTCLHVALDGAPCSDGDPCTPGDGCLAGACVAKAAVTCQDDLACTVDACDGQGGCLAPPLEGWCVLKGACVAADTSAPGNPCLACQPALGATAWTLRPDGTGCPATAHALAGTCDSGLCVPAPGACEPGWQDCEAWGAGCETAVWSDAAHCGACGAACATGAVCSAGECAPACGAGLEACGQSCVDLATHPLHCGSCGAICDGPQHSGVCSGGACGCAEGFGDVDGALWNGCECALAQGGVEVCNGKDDDCDGVVDDVAAAQATTPLGCGGTCTVCPSGDAQHHATCTGGVCGLVGCPAGKLDLDGVWEPEEPCEAECAPSGAEVCDGLDNDCSGVADDGLCLDGEACTVDACDPATGGCMHLPDDAACDDGNACTADLCDLSLGCLHPPAEGSPCDDGEPCTQPDTCQGGGCVGLPVGPACCAGDEGACDDGLGCTLDSCDVATVTCVHTQAPDGFPCADGDGCTQGDACAAGTCEAGAAVDCSPGDPCAGVCVAVPGGEDYSCPATPLPATTPCDDGDPCTSGDHCAQGTCQPGPDAYECGVAPGDCWTAACLPAGCDLAPKPAGTPCDLVGAGGCPLEGVCDEAGTCLTGGDCPELLVPQNLYDHQSSPSVVAGPGTLHFAFATNAPSGGAGPATITRGVDFEILAPELRHTTGVNAIRSHSLPDGQWSVVWSSGSTLWTRAMCHADAGTCPGGIAQGAPLEAAVSHALPLVPAAWAVWPQTGGYLLVVYEAASEIYGQRFSPGGAPLLATPRHYTPGSGGGWRPMVRSIQDAAQGILVWEQDDALWQRRIGPDGTTVGEASAVTAGDYTLTDLAVLDADTWLVAYTRPNGGGVEVARVKYPDLVEARTTLGFLGDVLARGWGGTLAPLADGTLALCFYSDADGAARQWFRMATTSLTPLGDPQWVGAVATSGGSGLRCTPLPPPGNRFVATWTAWNFAGGGGDDVVARIISPCGYEGACTGYACTADGECDDANACTVDSCALAAGACQHVPLPDYSVCSDGDGCTQGDFCLGPTCLAGPAVDCAVPDPCVGVCASLGAWAYECLPTKLPASTPCDDGDPCTAGDHCLAGACQTGPDPSTCGVGPGDCQTATCSAAGCEYAPKAAGTPCYVVGNGGCPQEGGCDAGGQCVLGEACPELLFSQVTGDHQDWPGVVALGESLHFAFSSRAYGGYSSPMTVTRNLAFEILAPESQHALAASYLKPYALADGHWAIAWSSGTSVHTRRMCHSDAGACPGGIGNGQPLASPVVFELGVTPGGWDLLPQAGGYLLTAFAASNDVLGRRFAPGGEALATSATLYTPWANGAWSPRLRAISGGQEALVVWEQDDALWQQRLEPSGAPIGQASKASPAGDFTLNDVAVEGGASWLVAYTRQNGAGVSVLRVTAPDGLSTAQNLGVVGNPAKGWGGALARFEDGTFVLCFQSDAVATERLWFQRIGADLAPQGSPEAIAAFNKTSGWDLRCAPLPGSGKRFVATWNSWNFPGSGGGDDVAARVLSW